MGEGEGQFLEEGDGERRGRVRMWSLGAPGQKQRCLPYPQVRPQALRNWARQDLGPGQRPAQRPAQRPRPGHVPAASHFSAVRADT